MKLPTNPNPIDRDRIAREDPLGKYIVWWKDFSDKDETDFAACLVRANTEQVIQDFLTQKPILLALQLGGGHGRWVIPQKRLGSEFVMDFILGEKSSIGFEWHAVELENPGAKMFTKSGDQTRELTHAINQIQNWRAWLRENQNYAAKSIDKGGLGLTEISADLPGIIFLRRRADISDSTKSLRWQMAKDSNIKIHTYDYLLDDTRGLID